MVLIPRSSPKATFGVKSTLPQQRPQETPGPGQYAGQTVASATFARSGAAVFGTSGRTPRHRPSPGPGSYSVQEATGAPSWTCSMRMTAEIPTAWDDGPGPGSYGPGSFLADGPKFSIATPRRNLSRHEDPGPGHYGQTYGETPQSARLRTPGFGFGTAARESMQKRSPGPGQYSMNSAMGSAPKYSMPPRRDKAPTESGPGPGAHDQGPQFGA